jgi:hypothetical protein
MTNLSLKGIGAGILAVFLLSIPLGFMFSYYFMAIYNDVAPGVNFASEVELREMTKKLIFHPLSIAFGILSTLITVGVPGYVAALVANKGYVLNSMVIGFITLLFFFLNFQLIAQFPVLVILFSVFTLGVAYLGGLVRLRQVKKSVG